MVSVEEFGIISIKKHTTNCMFRMARHKILIKMKNKRGPSTLPCRTLLVTGKKDDNTLLTVGTTVLIGKSFPDQETVSRSGNLYHVM